MEAVTIGPVTTSRFIMGGNPFSGFSHQSVDTDSRMRHWFTTERVKALFREAESLGVTSVISRADHHIMRLLMEYWDEGGTLQWLAQTCPELGTTGGLHTALNGGAVACHIHGGVTDHLLAEGRLGEVQDDINRIRDAGLAAGIAGHNPAVFEFARDHLDLDYTMCCYYNPTDRSKDPEHKHGAKEKFLDEDRRRVIEIIATMPWPVIHYKVLAAGRNDPVDAFAVAARAMRDGDAVCVGIYNQDVPDMLKQDIDLFTDAVEATRAAR